MSSTLRRLRRFIEPKALDPAMLALEGCDLQVVFRRHAQARRLVLRLNAEGTAALVTVPHGVARAQALDFVARSRGWLEDRLAQRGETIALAPGSHIPLRGISHEVRHIDSRRGLVTSDPLANVIHVPGDLAHIQRRLRDWLKTMARHELTRATQKYAEAMQVQYRRISVRDQKSRWGSCSAARDLSFSWRLIFTPDYVLDYVAAHEVAHLRHMHHGPAFWRLVLKHCGDAARARRWLREHGQSVHRIVA
jgi:predicted metal-dependent hydrolase